MTNVYIFFVLLMGLGLRYLLGKDAQTQGELGEQLNYRFFLTAPVFGFFALLCLAASNSGLANTFMGLWIGVVGLQVLCRRDQLSPA